MITEEDLKNNPKMAALVRKAEEKESKQSNRFAVLPVRHLETVMNSANKALASYEHYTEDEECEMLVGYLDELIMFRKVVNFTHIPNETYTESKTAKRKNKRLGVRAGFPDYAIITTKHFIVVEMKRKKGGVVSVSQQKWIDDFKSLGIPASVCNGFLEAKTFIEQYI